MIVDDRKHPGFLAEARTSFASVSPPVEVTLQRDGRVLRTLDVALATGFRGF